MTKQPKLKLNRQVLDEASEWFVDFREGDVSAEARERFDAWLRQSPEHIRAYMDIAKTYVVLPTLNRNNKFDVQQLIDSARSDANIVSLERPPHPHQPMARSTEPPSHPKRSSKATLRPRRFIAASMAIACAIVGFGLMVWLTFLAYPTYSTGIGERQTVSLTDGSTLDLNARSKVRVRFSKSQRTVELLQGQVLFEVAKDPTRPFIVRSGELVVRAVGTQFDVYRKTTGTTVTVVEGRVAVLASPGSPNPAPADNPHLTQGPGERTPEPTKDAVFVSAGEQVTVTDDKLPQPQKADVTAVTAWTQHRLVFDGSRLSDVADEFNRYNTRQIVLTDRSLDDFHISGIYSPTDPSSLIRFLRAQPGIEVSETDQAVHIGRK